MTGPTLPKFSTTVARLAVVDSDPAGVPAPRSGHNPDLVGRPGALLTAPAVAGRMNTSRSTSTPTTRKAPAAGATARGQ